MEMTKEILDKFYGNYQRNKNKYRNNKAYTKGKNPTILKDSKRKSPDNRIPVPLAKVAVDDMQGYAGRPGDRKVFWENISNMDENKTDEQKKESDFVDKMTKIYDFNKESLETSELYNDALIYGAGFEILWTTVGDGENVLMPEFKRVEPYSIEIIYSNDIKPVKLAGIYFWKCNTTGDDFADVYYPYKKERWAKVKGTWVKDAEGEEEYLYSQVPVVAFKANRDMDALFEAEKPLIDAHDTLLSKSVNEVDRFNALITLFPGKINKELKAKLEEIQVLDKLEEYDADKWPKFLEKNLAGVSDFYSGLADRLERLFHKSIKDPDMTDETFAGGESGIAIAYKLLGLEFKASEIDTYFNQGIFERDALIKDVINATTNINTEDYKTVVKTHRNLPVDEKSKLEIAVAMMGVGISKETILKFLPISIIENAEKELERIEGKNKDNEIDLNKSILEGGEDDQ